MYIHTCISLRNVYCSTHYMKHVRKLHCTFPYITLQITHYTLHSTAHCIALHYNITLQHITLSSQSYGILQYVTLPYNILYIAYKIWVQLHACVES